VKYDVEDGHITISPLQPDDVAGVAVVLTRSFATTLPSIDNGRKYAAEMLDKKSGALLLVMRHFPPITANDNNTNEQSPPPQDEVKNRKPYRVIGMASLSFNRDTREEFPSLQPPDDAVYLSNIAIDLSYRRQGYGTRMMEVCEEVARRRGTTGEMYLHVRLVDEGAEALYRCLGYETVDEDAWLVKLRGLTPRKMMRKKL
jgi:ribosomal protein S18 acetylase RimI-like enzyme